MDSRWGRIRNEHLKDRVVTAEEAASWIESGMTLGLSGFTRAGDAKAVTTALVGRARQDDSFKVNVFTGASLGADLDKLFTESGLVKKRLPFQSDATMRKGINQGDLLYVDQHLSMTAEMIRSKVLGVDVAIVEAIAITEDGMIIPTTSVGNSMAFALNAKSIIVEINMAQPAHLEGIHDLYELEEQGKRGPIPLVKVEDRIGKTGIPVDLEKVRGIVFTNQFDSPSPIVMPDEETERIASHLIEFLRREVKAGRMTKCLAPIEAGVGSVSNAVLHGLLHSEFEDLEIYSEVLQDAVFELMDAGKVRFASCCSMTLSEERMKQVFSEFEKYEQKLIMRPQEISNHPEVIRRLGLIAINTALETDIYGNVNSTHVLGTKMMNGIGGSGDFARNARLAIFVTDSIAKGGNISSIVPFVSHVDHTEHDVDVLVTEQGYADLRGLAPRERVELIINNCAHPMYRDQLRAYYKEALTRGGQTPHVLEKALSWHIYFAERGTMLEEAEITE
ncbi:acetyl-CoA hydrolase/transferase family protein [Pullulanibacillus sp. KACC 23026]|uniref:acetyl-CoA hydrolase/transferase family protein n=1 Tax=Pullulanibacillus sp. KACC 23026 TaxID=3028315 RepID=UPI0023B01F22|nr:acetyl-CoA hydrolase/transferase family protein [Pullulanibacillus sp. KACC 23026]WEG13550.1 acetyl-CoA hydrolase/transferase family protein [Pullulanibacillus sp. KACC 23026]